MKSNLKSYLKKDMVFMGQCGEKTNLTDSYGWKMCVGDYAEIRKENDSGKVTRFVVNPKEEAYIDGFKDALVISENDSGDGVIQYYLWNGEKYIVRCNPLHKDAYLFGEKDGISAVLSNIYAIRKGSVTTCCGYDFGTNTKNVKFCPVCGKHLLIKYSKPVQKKGEFPYWVTLKVDGRFTTQVSAENVEMAKKKASGNFESAALEGLEVIDWDCIMVEDHKGNYIYEK